MLESRNSIPFFKYFPIEMAKLKPREILSRLDVGCCGVSGITSQVNNRPFYSCVLSVLAFG